MAAILEFPFTSYLFFNEKGTHFPLERNFFIWKHQHGYLDHCAKCQKFGPEFARIRTGARRVFQIFWGIQGRLTRNTPATSYHNPACSSPVPSSTWIRHVYILNSLEYSRRTSRTSCALPEYSKILESAFDLNASRLYTWILLNTPGVCTSCMECALNALGF